MREASARAKADAAASEVRKKLAKKKASGKKKDAK